VTFVPLKFVDAEAQMRGAPVVEESEAEDFFKREWLRSLFELAIERLRAECAAAGKTLQFQVFERHDVRWDEVGPAPSYADLAQEHGISETQVNNYLVFARKRFRQHVLDALAELAGSDEEFAAEAREVIPLRD
jgi:DNA-directed RNA polymerase specialized sigma24 family protein